MHYPQLELRAANMQGMKATPSPGSAELSPSSADAADPEGASSAHSAAGAGSAAPPVAVAGGKRKHQAMQREKDQEQGGQPQPALLSEEVDWQQFAAELLNWSHGSRTMLNVNVSGCKLGVATPASAGCAAGDGSGSGVPRSKLESLLIALPVLQVLNIADNDIGPHGALVLARAMASNQSLQVLNISGNKLLGVSVTRGSVCGTLHLEPFRQLLQALTHNTTLTHLNLSNNRLGGVYTGARSSVTGDVGGGSCSTPNGRKQLLPTRSGGAEMEHVVCVEECGVV